MSIPASNKEGCLDYVKGCVEEALRTNFGTETYSLVSHLRGEMSIHPERVGPNVNAESLHLQCQSASFSLKEGLVRSGLQIRVVSSGDRSVMAEHVYLVAGIDPEEIIIEPTIGQIILGHNHVFVGFRRDLKKVVLEMTGGSDLPYQMHPLYARYHQEYPEEIFRHFWGDKSRSFP